MQEPTGRTGYDLYGLIKEEIWNLADGFKNSGGKTCE